MTTPTKPRAADPDYLLALAGAISTEVSEWHSTSETGATLKEAAQALRHAAFEIYRLDTYEAQFVTIRTRIGNYLGNGGLFNPESMDHSQVRDLLIDIARMIDEPKE